MCLNPGAGGEIAIDPLFAVPFDELSPVFCVGFFQDAARMEHSEHTEELDSLDAQMADSLSGKSVFTLQ